MDKIEEGKVHESTERIDVQRNKMTIRNAIIEYLETHPYPPSITELEEIVGLTQKVISKHIKEMDLFETDKAFYKVFTPEIIMNIREGSKKHPASQKLWLQVVEGWNEKTETDVTFIDPDKAIEDLEKQFE